jgi:glutathionyl-hydroquinone reductase
MGLLIDGRWHDQWYDTSANGGRFVRSDSVFRNWVTTDGTTGPTGIGGYRAEAGRYHLYVSLACPWAHRTLIFRALKGLTPLIDVSVVHWLMAEQGWSFDAGDGVVPDPVGGAHYLHEVYTRSDPTYSGHVTVPVLWDKKTGTIVNNESSDIIRMFNTAFDGIGAKAGDYYPEALRTEIDGLNARIYATVNNGVYRAGFATNGRRNHGSRLAAVHDADPVRSRLCRPFQMQHPEDCRLSAPFRLYAHPVPDRGCRSDGQSWAHQAPLLSEPPHIESEWHRSGRTGACVHVESLSGIDDSALGYERPET